MAQVYTQRQLTVKTLYTRIMLAIIVTLMTLSMSLQAFANTGTVIAVPGTHAMQIQEAVSKMTHNTIVPKEGESSGANIFSVSGSNVNFDIAEFEKGTKKSQQQVMSAFISEVEKSTIPSSTRRKVMDGVQNSSDTVNKMMIPLMMSESGADMYGSQQVIKGGIPAFKIIMGILAHLIIYGLVLSTLLDLMYMGLPFARNFGTGKDGGGDQKPAWVTFDAYSAIRDSESGEEYKNPYFKYGMRRAWTYIIIAFLITWLVVGELGSVIALFMSLGDGVISSE